MYTSYSVHMLHTTCRIIDDESYLVLAIKHQLQPLVKSLCEKGVDLGTVDRTGSVPLWVALRSKQENIASMLVCVCVRMYVIYVCVCVCYVCMYVCVCAYACSS